MLTMIEIDGDVFYFDGGKLHKENGPAVIYKSGMECWFFNGKLHRENGPAVIQGNHKEYWINDHKASYEEKKNIKRNYWIEKML